MGYFEKQQLDGLKLLLNHLAVAWDFAEDCEAAVPVPASSVAGTGNAAMRFWV